MRIGKLQRSCVVTSGLLIAAFTSNCCFCTISLGQSGSFQRNEGTIRIVETTGYELPSTDLEEETSPSDSTQDSEIKEAVKPELKDAPKQTEAVKPTKNDSITPVQNRAMTIRVQAVSISNDKIGTGLIPQSTPARNTQLTALPTGASRGMSYSHVCWRASNIQHFPLYFEDAMLERHGHTRCCAGYECTQSLVSGAKFFGTIPLLPYLCTLRPKHDCVYALGHTRPGSAAPCLRDNIPYDAKAAIVESASAAAFFWGMPL